MTVAGERQRPGAAEAMAAGGRGSGRRRERQWPAGVEAVSGGIRDVIIDGVGQHMMLPPRSWIRLGGGGN